jgi:hypothetical protein
MILDDPAKIHRNDAFGKSSPTKDQTRHPKTEKGYEPAVRRNDEFTAPSRSERDNETFTKPSLLDPLHKAE